MVTAPACKFPGCSEPEALEDEEGFSLCLEHRRLLLDDPGEFRRRWGAIDPRPETLRAYTPRWRGAGSAPRDE
jgi:hypothetical protein